MGCTATRRRTSKRENATKVRKTIGDSKDDLGSRLLVVNCRRFSEEPLGPGDPIPILEPGARNGSDPTRGLAHFPSRLCKVDHPGWRRLKPASLIEHSKGRLIIDVQPCCSLITRDRRRLAYQTRSDPAPLVVRMNRWIQSTSAVRRPQPSWRYSGSELSDEPGAIQNAIRLRVYRPQSVACHTAYKSMLDGLQLVANVALVFGREDQADAARVEFALAHARPVSSAVSPLAGRERSGRAVAWGA